MATVFLPAQLKDLTGGLAQLQLDAGSVREVIEALDRRFPGIRQRLCDGDELSPTLQLSIDHVLTSRGLAARVGPESEIHFLPAIGGG